MRPRCIPATRPRSSGDQHTGWAAARLDDQVRFLEGFFKDTLAEAAIERIAVLRLDGDFYESTMTSLVALYDRVSPGGFVIIDDYALPPCREAVDEFRAQRRVRDPLVETDWTEVYWRKAGAASRVSG